jgi:HlyD family secretion protein
VRQVRKAAQTVANVVTYVAVIGFSNNGGRLLPGMTANVRVITEAREKVTSEMRQKIMAMLIAAQKPKYQQLIVAQQQTRASGAAPSAATTSENTTKLIAT